ncbi:MAG: hypothetical protein ICV79_17160 [Flavisolibacter sp.]|nr:hypothetical protein [Flavisolibacter sp.]
MKKRFVVLATAFVLSLSVAFAQEGNGKPVPAAIAKELQQEFKDVSNVEWKTTENFYKASFTVDGYSLEAFYSFDGKLQGVSRNISVEQLPMSLVREVKEKMSTYSVAELFELLTDRGTEYFITFKNDKETKTYKSSGGDWIRY